MKPTQTEVRAAAEAAIGKRQAAVDAKAAADAAGGADQALNTAATTAQDEATAAETHALELSQALPPADDKDRKKAKLLRKREFINKDLRELGVDPDDEDEEEDDEQDLDKPVTFRDLAAIEARQSRKTAQEMANEIADPLDKAAVLRALPLVVATADPAADFQRAVAIANIDRNSKILDEVARNPVTRTSPTTTGAPVRREEAFVPTAYEIQFMRQFGLTKEAVLKARGTKQ